MKRPQKKKKVLGFSEAETRAARAAMQKQATGTPMAVLRALIPEVIRLGEIELQPVTGSTILALQKIESSFTKSDNPTDFPIGDIARCLFVFITPIDRVRTLLGGTLFRGTNDAGGFVDFDRSVEAMCDRLAPSELVLFGPLLNKHIATAFETAVPYRAKGTGGGDFPQAPVSGPVSAGS